MLSRLLLAAVLVLVGACHANGGTLHITVVHIHLGLIGVAIGTLIAVLYRTCYFVIYLSKDILCRKIKHFIKHMMTDVISASILAVIVYSFDNFYSMSAQNYFAWIVLAIKVCITDAIIMLFVNIVLYKKRIDAVLKMLLKRENYAEN